MHTYEQNARGENHGIYTALFDNLRDSGVSDLTNQYVTAQKLDARFAFENNSKELLFDNFQVACDVLLAKYYSKWVNLIQGVLKSSLPAGVRAVTISHAFSCSGSRKAGRRSITLRKTFWAASSASGTFFSIRRQI